METCRHSCGGCNGKGHDDSHSGLETILDCYKQIIIIICPLYVTQNNSSNNFSSKSAAIDGNLDYSLDLKNQPYFLS